MKDFGFYLVMTDPVVGYEKCCEAAVRAEVAMVQLRMKSRVRDIPRSEVLDMAKRLVKITRGSKTKLVIDDDPSVAADSGADGVHVGQDDIPVEMIRNRWPEIPYVGLSTHNLVQAQLSVAAHPDYIGVGPVFPTPTKVIPDPVLGVEEASKMIAAVPYAAVAIGGITPENLSSVIEAGAKNWAVVRAVCQSEDPYAAITGLRSVSDAALAAVAKKSSAESVA
ncbi:MAG: thiamine phosphate synthase [Kiritimatiellae bacterium]|nr:thiamine phosphate synthase [Kiritimatiellia bacterium]